MSVNSEDWDVYFAFPDFNLALLERERRWCRNWIVTFPWKKICSVFENFNADHAWRWEGTGRNSRGFPKKINERIPFDNDNKLTLKSFFAFCSVFFKLFQHGEFVFTFSETLCCVLLFSWANKNCSWHLSNDCQIARPALVSGPPNWKKPYNKHLISLVFFRSVL